MPLEFDLNNPLCQGPLLHVVHLLERDGFDQIKESCNLLPSLTDGVVLFV